MMKRLHVVLTYDCGDVSHDINGLGEISERCATPIMWDDRGILEFGKLQQLFRAYGVGSEALEHRKTTQPLVEGSLPDLAWI